MKFIPTLGMALFLAILYAACALSSSSSSARTKPITDKIIDDVIAEEMVLQDIVGITVGIIQNGVITHTKAYGYKDQERTRTITTNTVFRWASVSKPLTAVAIFKAITDGHLRLHDKVHTYVPAWSSEGDKGNITVADLLSHRSGINHYGKNSDDEWVCTIIDSGSPSTSTWDALSSVLRFSDCSLLFPPNTKHTYSSFGYDLLGAVLEGATGMDYVAYVNEHITTPANLTSLDAFANSPGGFKHNCNLRRMSKTVGGVRRKIPSGGWSSNIQDMARFVKGIMDNDFLPNSAVLWPDIDFPTNNRKHYYGVQKEQQHNTDYIYHSGSHSDVTTFIGFFPGDKNGVCIMMNSGKNARSTRVGEKLLVRMGYSNLGLSTHNLPVINNNGEKDCGETVSSVWRTNGNAATTVLRRNLTHDNFNIERNSLKSKGWFLVDIETHLDGTVRKWDGIFRKDVTPTSLWRGFNTEEWFEKYQEEKQAGKSLIDLEVYLSGTALRWAGIFQSGHAEPNLMARNFNSEEFSEKYFEMQDAGRKIIDIETYVVNGQRKWAGVWLGNGRNIINRNIAEEDFLDLIKTRKDDGFLLRDLETYKIGTSRRFAAVWERSLDNQKFTLKEKMGAWVNSKHVGHNDAGHELLDIETH